MLVSTPFLALICLLGMAAPHEAEQEGTDRSVVGGDDKNSSASNRNLFVQTAAARLLAEFVSQNAAQVRSGAAVNYKPILAKCKRSAVLSQIAIEVGDCCADSLSLLGGAESDAGISLQSALACTKSINMQIVDRFKELLMLNARLEPGYIANLVRGVFTVLTKPSVGQSILLGAGAYADAIAGGALVRSLAAPAVIHLVVCGVFLLGRVCMVE